MKCTEHRPGNTAHTDHGPRQENAVCGRWNERSLLRHRASRTSTARNARRHNELQNLCCGLREEISNKV